MKLFVLIAVFLLTLGCTSPPSAAAHTTATTAPANCDATCSGISGSTKALCQVGCYSEQAAKTGDASVCENVKTLNNGEGLSYVTCLVQVAGKLNNSGPCDRVQNSSLRDTCYLTFLPTNRDSANCEKLSGDDRKALCHSMYDGFSR